MLDKDDEDKKRIIFPGIFSQLREINLGIVLISIYFVFEFGSIQGLFSIVGALKLPYVLAFITISYAIYILLTENKIRNLLNYKYIFFILYLTIYTIISTKPIFARDDLVKLLCTFCSHYIIILHCVRKPSQFYLLLNIWLLSISFSSFHGIRQGGLIWGNRWLKDENHLSLVVAIAFPFAYTFFVVNKNKILKICYLLCMLIFIAANVAASSRGGALALIVCGMLCLTLDKNKIRSLFIIVIAIMGVVLIAPEHKSGLKYFDELRTLEMGTQEGTAGDRIYLWGIALDMFSDYPIFGVGPLMYPYNFEKYEGGKVYSVGFRAAHSTPVQGLAEVGLFGSVFFLIIQFGLYKNWRNITFLAAGNEKIDEFGVISKINHACIISHIVFWVAAMFLTLLPYPFYWVLVPFSDSWKNICYEEYNISK